MVVAAYTKSGGSWLTWMLIDAIHKPDFLCDQVNKTVLDRLIHKTEIITASVPDVHLIRHPLDIMCSMWNYMLLTNRANPQQENEFYHNYLTNGQSSLNSTPWTKFVDWANNKDTIQIKYDDLVADTRSELQRVLPDTDISNTIQKYSVEALRERESESSKKINRPTNENYSFYYMASSFYYKQVLPDHIISKGHALFREQIQQYWPNTLGDN